MSSSKQLEHQIESIQKLAPGEKQHENQPRTSNAISLKPHELARKSANSPQEFSQKLVSIAISHLLFHLGFDRIQGFAMGVLTDLLGDYIILLARKACKNSIHGLRTKASLFDIELGTPNTSTSIAFLEKYLNDISTSKSNSMKNGGFPRLAPESLVINLTDLEGLLRGGDNDEDMQADEPVSEVKKDLPLKTQTVDEDGDIEMDEVTEELDGKEESLKQNETYILAKDSSNHDPFPPIPLEVEDDELLECEDSKQVVPTWDQEYSKKEEEKYEDDIYYFTQQLEGGMDSFLNLKIDEISDRTVNSTIEADINNTQDINFISNQPENDVAVASSSPAKHSMDDLLARAIESHILHHSYNDSKHLSPLISHKFILTLLAFRSGQHLGVSIADGNGGGSSGYETKSILSDLLLLRTPALPFLYGGEEDLEPDGRLASEVYQMPRTRKKEKARDSGQGKAPVKTAEQKAERKRMMEEAAARKKQALAEAAVRREVKYLAKLERAESKGIKLDPASLARKEELKKRVGGIIITRKETKRDKAKREKMEAEAAAKAASSGMSLHTGRDNALSSKTPLSAGLTTANTAGTISSAASLTHTKDDDMPSDDDDDELDIDVQHQLPPPLPLPKSPSRNNPVPVLKPASSTSIKLKLTASSSPRKVVLKLPPKPISSQPLSAESESIKSLEEKIMCICTDSSVDFGLAMVSCEKCFVWFHASCVGWSESSISDFICSRCSH